MENMQTPWSRSKPFYSNEPQVSHPVQLYFVYKNWYSWQEVRRADGAPQALNPQIYFRILMLKKNKNTWCMLL